MAMILAKYGQDIPPQWKYDPLTTIESATCGICLEEYTDGEFIVFNSNH